MTKVKCYVSVQVTYLLDKIFVKNAQGDFPTCTKYYPCGPVG